MDDERYLELRQQRQISRIGGAAAILTWVNLVAQAGIIAFITVLNTLLKGSSDLGMTEALLIASLSMYLAAYPVSSALLMMVPKCGSPEREHWGMGRFSICMVLMFGVGFGGNVLGILVNYMLGRGGDQAQMIELLDQTSLWVNLLTTVFLAPAAEELFFRKLMLDRLLGFGQLPAILLTAMLFGLAHGNLSQFFYAFGLGLIFGYVYAKTGRIGYTIALHMIFNMIGGVVMMELGKIGQGTFTGHSLLLWLEESVPGIGILFQHGAAFIILVLLLLEVAAFAGSIAIAAGLWRKISLDPGRWPLKKGRRLKTVFLNAGMISFIVTCGISFLLLQ